MPTYLAQGSQVASNSLVLSRSIPESFSCDIIHEILRLVDSRDTLGCFHALAIDSFAPNNMKWISLRVTLGNLGKLAFSRAVAGVFGIW